jgi:Mrp family chromosome partitioning ATPase
VQRQPFPFRHDDGLKRRIRLPDLPDVSGPGEGFRLRGQHRFAGLPARGHQLTRPPVVLEGPELAKHLGHVPADRRGQDLHGLDDAVIWRGPLIARMITQFWEDVFWGKLDYLIVDLPPGTADAPLTVLQSLPVYGVIIVFTPQDLTQMVVRKAVNMARKMEKPILGVVENMSYLTLPETGKRLEVFGRSRGKEMAETAGAPLLASLPLDPNLAALCDAGDIEQYGGVVMEQFAASLGKMLRQRE